MLQLENVSSIDLRELFQSEFDLGPLVPSDIFQTMSRGAIWCIRAKDVVTLQNSSAGEVER